MDLVRCVEVRADGIGISLAAATGAVRGVLAGAGGRLTVPLPYLFLDVRRRRIRLWGSLLGCHDASLSISLYIGLLFQSDLMASSWTSFAVMRSVSAAPRSIFQLSPAQQRRPASTTASNACAAYSSNP